MRRRASFSICVLGALGVVAACSGDDENRPGGYAGSSGSSASGGSSGSAGAAGSSAGSAGIDGGGGTSGSAGSSGGSAGSAGSSGSAGSGGGDVCGDGVASANEACDGTDLNGNDCSTVGFQTGTLACTGSCAFDTSGCSGTEYCYDGVDNDGDTSPDCFDSDCSAACSSSCASPPALADPAKVTGNTKGHVNQSDPSCSRPGFPSGPEIIYSLTPAKTGVLDLKLTTGLSLNVSVRTACNDPKTELGCNAGKRLRVPVTAGTPLFIVIDGVEAMDAGAYQLEVESREITCGDGHRDGSEGCDDANQTPGDGCSSTCTVESSEIEPNGTIATAGPLVTPFFGTIAPIGDVDVIQVTVAAAGATLTADTFDFGDGACGWDELDSQLELLGSSGAVLASDDDGGVGYCAHLVATGLAAGTYFVRVKSPTESSTPTFPYVLSVSVQ